MGACFVPSVANIFMAHLETKTVFKDKPKQFMCYDRFKDDLFFSWNENALRSFMKRMDANDYNIILSWYIDTSRAVFLDLKTVASDGKFIAKNNFKPTNCKGYIATDSCHKNWLFNIPREQFITWQSNCSFVNDYERATSRDIG